MQPLDLLLLALAVWRAAYFVVREDGPFHFMRAIRQRTTLGGLLDCIYCASVWAAIALYLAYVLYPPVVWVIAASGGAMLLHRYTGGDFVQS